MENKDFFETLKEIEKQFGKGTIYSPNEKNEIDVIPTGNLHLNRALGIGGYPKGRIIEIYGNESSGKTTLALQAVSQCQKSGGIAAYIDVENALTAEYCAKNNVDLNKMLLAQPDSGEQAFSIMEALIKTGKVNLIIVDSVAALTPEQELKGDFNDQNIGLHARMMSKGLRIIQSLAAKYNVAIIFINQIREKVNTGFIALGNNETTTGGRALKFYSSMRIEIKRQELIKNNGECIGIRSNARIVKNKLAAPLKVAPIDIYFSCGFDYVNEIIDFALERELIEKKGTWYYYNGESLGQGREAAKKMLLENQEIYQKVHQEVLEKCINI